MSTASSPHLIRAVHDKENPYVMLNKQAMRDPQLSLEAVGLWARILCHKDDWTIHVTQLMKANKCGKEKMYRILNELITHGYAYCLRDRQKGKYGKTTWFIFESQMSKDDIQKMFPHPEKPDTAKPDLANPPLMNNDISISNLIENKEERESKKVAPPPSPPSAVADSLTLLFLQKVKEHLPNLKPPNLQKWAQEMDKLLRLDGRSEAQVREAIGWFHNDLWFKKTVIAVKGLRTNFDKIQSARLIAKEKNRIQENRSYAKAFKEQFPKETKPLTFNSKFVINEATGKELPFDLPPETFEKEVIRLFGGRHASY